MEQLLLDFPASVQVCSGPPRCRLFAAKTPHVSARETFLENDTIRSGCAARILRAVHSGLGTKHSGRYHSGARHQSFCAQSNARRGRRPHCAGSHRQGAGAAGAGSGFEFRLAAGDVSPEYGIGGGSLALESAGNVERSERKWKGIFHGLREPNRIDSLFVWVLAAASRIYAQRWNRQRRFFPDHRRRPEQLLEKQSVPDPTIHRRKRFIASAMDRGGPGATAANRRDATQVDRPVRDSLRRPVLDRR